MENRALDHLFKTELETPAAYHSAEAQWETVAARLAQPSRRKPVWWWLLGAGMGIVLLCLVLLPKAGESQPVIGAFQIPIATTIRPSADAVASGEVSSENTEEFDEEAIDLPESAQKSTFTIAKDGKKNRNKLASLPPIEKEEVVENSSEPETVAAMAEVNIYEDRQRITAIPESLHVAGIVSNIMTLPLAELVSNAVVITPVSAKVSFEEAPVVTVASVARWALEIGVQQDFISSERIAVSDPRLQYYSAVALDFSPNWQARLAYGRGDIERTITGDPSTYRIPIVDAPSGGGSSLYHTTPLPQSKPGDSVGVSFAWAEKNGLFDPYGPAMEQGDEPECRL
jgi:hypothetical protein